MNPVVVIATHERIEITTKNVFTLLAQKVVPLIILVTSHAPEAYKYRRIFAAHALKIKILIHPNSPLGAKWQVGVDEARRQKADPLIINGSDDILGRDFIGMAIEGLDYGYDFIGLKQWAVFNPRADEAYVFNYKNFMPLGGGRVYSKTLLEIIDYNLFDTSKARHLDDRGWNSIQSTGLMLLPNAEQYGFGILSVKGDWPVMNPLDKMFGHKNAELVEVMPKPAVFLKEKFNYE